MKKLFPSPLLSVGLFVLWISLMQSMSMGTVTLGLVLAWFWPVATARLRPTPVRARKPMMMVRLFATAVLAMVRSNVEVAVAILARRKDAVRSGFVRIPLELREPNGLAVLAMILTFTPGTAWVQLSADGSALLLHVLAISDEDALIRLIKHDYERPLMEIFG